VHLLFDGRFEEVAKFSLQLLFNSVLAPLI